MNPVNARLPVRPIKPLEADPLLDLAALRLGALVVPEDRGPHHGAVDVEDDQAVHLARETDAEEVEPTHLLEGPLGRRPPVRGILLGPAGAWRRERIAVLAPREDAAVRRNRDELDPRRADVQTDERVQLPRLAARQAPAPSAA